MKYNKLSVAVAAFAFAAVSAQNSNVLKYPETKKVSHTDTYFGTQVSDPYRWLEDDRAEDTKAWVQQEVKFTQDYLAQIPFRDQLKKQLMDIWNYEKISAPFKKGKYTYFSKNDGLQAQSVLYRKDAAGKTEVFLDPNKFSEKGTTSLASVSFNKKGTLVAYSISEGGSDWNKIIILDAETKKQLDETLLDVKFSGISWLGDEGFFYSSYDKPKEGSVLSGMTDKHKVYFHKLGTKQSQDELIIGGDKFPRRYIGAYVTDDQRYLVVSAANATNGNELYIKDLKNKTDFIPIITGFYSNVNVADTDGDTLYLFTDKDAPNKRLVKTTIQNPKAETWKDVIAETSEPLEINTGGGYFFATYMKDAIDQVKQYDKNGKLVRAIKLPGSGNASGFGGEKTEKDLYYSFTNYITPPTIFKYNVTTGNSEVYQKPKVKFNPENYVSEQVFYTSSDGTKIPMMISYKKGLKKDGKNPTILYSYGGFNISLQPAFSVVNAIWMENGGIYAVPNIRGGGEYGKKWHDAGTKMQKKNVFNDFIAAGEYLQKNGYTSKEYMALSGRSNGGLLVGATMTMRPDLAKVAFPGVGVLDMLRYNKFTAGAGWAYDYGTAEDSREMFEYLKSYSPVHNVKAGTCYPSTMVITSDHDDRVVPAHSFKFGSELQAKQSCNNPVLIRIETNAGHGAGRSTEQVVAENADLLSFALYEMGIKSLK
ncbi:prolyl oligopeptidase family serine peptidase [Elizabethkingia meningoseptica]|uniref:prolyl oligopeptidase family serine peptidase n=1 Tax=Elizabethkingia meningoseptica TaxID=238 RepID=UPI0023B0958D|nr:prolyl oligopeptidase family serine peptidase [Elizabethkingia meningoseptica]MDE5468556.1 prolyl oligopeptidase family serine peptidase [Elizabethkingia meningoseptica]MDE5475391.1 prolyl oligopeptidase family serine peptidase [Elizabethkingia meningoseptica]MDE5480098.1 prolyl oligopeptidase family serine peptidase [Elizabethkingia meningoseptica]MDE5487163.1 prolyl oligopeptidase family serine peptidase [Elizabethkingia meningoseptica]MDE5503501.1 prolyl oligopeptidase family serine pept